MTFDPIQGTEPVTKAQVEALGRAAGGPLAAMVARLHEVDVSAGRGILGGDDRCLWTDDGCRITVTLLMDSGVILSVSQDPDPAYPNRAKTPEAP